MLKNISIILIILFSIIVYNRQVLSKNNEKANNTNSINYKIYSNDDYGFKFKYPANLQFQDIGIQEDFEAIHTNLKLSKILELNLKLGFCAYTCTIDKFLAMYQADNLKDLDSKLLPKLINKIKYYADETEGSAAMGGRRSKIFSYATIQNNNCLIFVQEIGYGIYEFATEGGDLPRSLTKNEQLALDKWLANQKKEFEIFLSSVKFYDISGPGPGDNS